MSTTTEENGKRATCIIYARAARNDDNTLEQQIEKLKEIASDRGLSVVAVYSDTGSGLKRFTEHPGLNAAIAALADGEANALLIRDVDRLARSDYALIEVTERLRELRVDLHLAARPQPLKLDDRDWAAATGLSHERMRILERTHARIIDQFLSKRATD